MWFALKLPECLWIDFAGRGCEKSVVREGSFVNSSDVALRVPVPGKESISIDWARSSTIASAYTFSGGFM